jgi:hypothetical protein
MESLECHISSPVKTICFFKSLLRAPPLRCQLVQGIRNWLPCLRLTPVPLAIRPAVPNTWRRPGQFSSARALHVSHKLTDDQSHNENRCSRQLNRSPVRIGAKLERSLRRSPKILRAPRP